MVQSRHLVVLLLAVLLAGCGGYAMLDPGAPFNSSGKQAEWMNETGGQSSAPDPSGPATTGSTAQTDKSDAATLNSLFARAAQGKLDGKPNDPAAAPDSPVLTPAMNTVVADAGDATAPAAQSPVPQKVMTPRGRASILAQLFGWGAILMALGWFASCATRMYDVPPSEVQQNASTKLAKNPVIPSREQFEKWKSDLKEHRWSEALAEPPFVPPPHSHDPDSGKVNKQGLRETDDKSDLYRKWNYWMMSQRVGSISYLTFAAGFSLALYGLFYILADMLGIKIGVFRTFGTNALVGYILHDFTSEAIKNFIPHDAPPMVMWASVAFFFYMTWLFIRSLEKRNIFLKL